MAAASTGFAYGMDSLLINRTEPELLSSPLHRGGVLATSSFPLSAAARLVENPLSPSTVTFSISAKATAPLSPMLLALSCSVSILLSPATQTARG